MKKKKGLIITFIILFVLAYLISPVDFIPDVVAGLGQIDDLLVILAGLSGVIGTFLYDKESTKEVENTYTTDSEYKGSYKEV